MIYALFLITIISNAIMDAITSNDAFAKYGKWFSREGWEIKHDFAIWLNKFLPLWLSDFIAMDVLVVFTELYKFAKMIMIASFITMAFGFTYTSVVLYFVWGLSFSIVYSLIR